MPGTYWRFSECYQDDDGGGGEWTRMVGMMAGAGDTGEDGDGHGKNSDEDDADENCWWW